MERKSADITLSAMAQTVDDIASELAKQAGVPVGSSWIDNNGRIHTYFKDDDPASENDWWDNFWNLDYSPQHYQEVKTASGSAAYAYALSNGIGLSNSSLNLSNSQSYSSFQASNTTYTGRWGVACPSGDTDCEAISPG